MNLCFLFKVPPKKPLLETMTEIMWLMIYHLDETDPAFQGIAKDCFRKIHISLGSFTVVWSLIWNGARLNLYYNVQYFMSYMHVLGYTHWYKWWNSFSHKLGWDVDAIRKVNDSKVFKRRKASVRNSSVCQNQSGPSVYREPHGAT